MGQIDGGELTIRALEREGIDRIFTLHGGHVDPLYQACLRHNIRVIDFRHEQAAASIADGYARVSGGPGFCTASVGPGVMNLMIGLGSAAAASSPVVAVTRGGRLRSEILTFDVPVADTSPSVALAEDGASDS